MTPQFDSQKVNPRELAMDRDRTNGPHLTSDQFGDLLGRSVTETAPPEAEWVDAHLHACQQCSAELAELRQSLALFRDATSAYADKQMRPLPRLVPVRRAQVRWLIPTYWATAAAAMLLTALLPLQVLRQHSPSAQPAAVASSTTASGAIDHSQSDEALLDDVDREVSASVPTPMQALADPSASSTSTSTDDSDSASTQRKN
jgi:anti-sigma factor RsiW